MAVLEMRAAEGRKSLVVASAFKGLDPCNNSSGANGALALAAAYRSLSRFVIDPGVSLLGATWYRQL
jgi:hypothetical protein